MVDARIETRQRARRAARDPPRHAQPPVAWLTWCAVALVAGAALRPVLPDAPSLAAIAACISAVCGATAVMIRPTTARRAAGAIAMSLCLASCCMLGAAWRQRADDSWTALVRHITPDSAPRLIELEGIALKPPSSDERSHLHDGWGDTLSRFTPPSPSSSLDMRVLTPYGSATVRVRVDGHRLAVLAGDRVRATGWVRALGAATNPGGFDGERWSASRRIAAIMDSESPAMVVSNGADPGIDATLARWRASVEDRLQQSMPGRCERHRCVLAGSQPCERRVCRHRHPAPGGDLRIQHGRACGGRARSAGTVSPTKA